MRQFSENDISTARRDTPGCHTIAHFNNAGAALMPRCVVDAVKSHLDLEARIGGYEAARHEKTRLQNTYLSIANLLGCRPEEIAIIENATRAWDMAFYAIPFKAGDRILTSLAEYGSNYIAYLQLAQKTGVIIEVIPNDDVGQVSVEALKSMIDDQVRLISVTHVPTNGGLVNPAEAIGAVAREAKTLYLLDACQSVGQMPVDVEKIGCDILSATGRKYLRGPRGTGFLYVRSNLIESLEPPFLDLHAATWTETDKYIIRPDARRFENWESYIAGKIGLGAAVDYALSWGLDVIQDRVTQLADLLRSELDKINGVTVHDIGHKKCGIVTFIKSGLTASHIQSTVEDKGFNVSISETSSTRLDMEARELTELVRASVHYYNTEDEIHRFCDLLSTL